jgi:hypothetical protein
MIEPALAESGGRVSGPSGTAAKLGMPRSALDSKIRSLKLTSVASTPTSGCTPLLPKMPGEISAISESAALYQ